MARAHEAAGDRDLEHRHGGLPEKHPCPVQPDAGIMLAERRPEMGAEQALELAHQIILASASIPGAFPPADIEVVADGKTYNEMHVDGGVSRQVFMYPPSYRPKVVDKAIGWKAKRTLYAIRNNKLDPEYST